MSYYQGIALKVKGMFAVVGAFIGSFFGGMDGLLYTLVALMVIDYITGVVVAIVEERLSSEIGFKGIAKKVFMLLLVGIANLLDLHVLGGGASAIRTAVILFYIANEGISILENASVMGLPIPEKLKDALLQLKEDKNDDVET